MNLWTRRKRNTAMAFMFIVFGCMGLMGDTDGFGLGWLSVMLVMLVLFIIMVVPPKEN